MNRIPIANDLAWPQIVRPRRPILYLDLNHFIEMARAIDADPSARAEYKELYEASRAAVEEKRVIIPLSSSHLHEMAGIRDPKQRNKVANVMEELSGFQYLLGRVEIARLEISAGMRKIFGETSNLPPVLLIGPSFGWSFGMRGGLKLVRKDNHEDASAETRRAMGAENYDQLMRQAYYTIERAMLAGPSDEEDEILRAGYGYAPEVAREGQKSRLAFELEFSEILTKNPRWRQGRLRDAVSAREITHEWLDAIIHANEDRTQAGQPVLNLGDDNGRQFMAAMPHTQVAISIKTRYHRNPAHQWTTNDIIDIDAISVAYAYCDVVFTDKAVRAALTDSRDLRTFETVLPRKLGELIEWVKRQPSLISADLLIPHPPKAGQAV